MAATTKFGTKAPIKKMFGTKEVLKEVLNGVTVYTNTPPVHLTFLQFGTTEVVTHTIIPPVYTNTTDTKIEFLQFGTTEVVTHTIT